MVKKKVTEKPASLDTKALYRYCDPTSIPFASTEQATEKSKLLLGQVRAEHAIRFGVSIKRDGYNLYVLGSSGAGKHRFSRTLIEEKAALEPPPSDWVYLFNFEKNNQPISLTLPAGKAQELKVDLEELIEGLLDAIPSALSSEVYQSHINEIESEFDKRREQAMSELRQEAQSRSLELARSPRGLMFLPVKDNKVIDIANLDELSAADQDRIKTDIDALQTKLQNIMIQIPRWQKEAREKIRALDTEITLLSISYLIEDLKSKHQSNDKLCQHFEAIKQDVVDNLNTFRELEQNSTHSHANFYNDIFLRRYLANVLVSRKPEEGAPVVYEDNPTHDNLLGRVEHLSQMGTLLTDFTLIKPGALHRANGGYLILDANKIFSEPLAWDALKRCLSSKHINIQSLAQSMGLFHTVSLEPELVPLDVKVILLGNRSLYYQLCELEPDFHHHFKVAADFEDSIEWNAENGARFSHLIADISRNENLLAFDRSAIARVIEQSARIVEDTERLDVNLEDISDLLREADFWARQENSKLVQRAHIQKAIDEQEYRLARIQTRYYDSISRGTTIIETDGSQVAQINALTVIDLGQFSFGQPSRITATARAGDGKILDIEQEADLGGDIHTKAMLILTHFLSARYARNKTLSVSASLAFEQSYAEIEGDSASVAELCVLLSAIANLPIRQDLAVTGSIDQRGTIQAVGGINEKIEGFFNICDMRGLTGKQGVLIPEINVRHLMLNQRVIEAVKKKIFHIYTITTIDDAITLFFDKPAGQRDKSGEYPEGSVNYHVEVEMLKMSETTHPEPHDHDQEKNESEEEK